MTHMHIRRAALPRAVRELVAAAVPGLAERMMVARVRREWDGAVGPELAPGTFPLDLDRGTLSVGAETSACLQELTLRMPDILLALASRFGGAVTAVRPCLRRRAAEPSTPAVPDAPPSDATLTPAETESITRLLAAIPDPLVAAAARRVLVKDHLARRARLAHPPQSRGNAEPPRSPARTA
jgi:Dna[CI] antecedent, DciA